MPDQPPAQPPATPPGPRFPTRPASLRSARLATPWPDIAPLVDGTPPGRLNTRQAQLWSLVLRSRRVPHRVRAMGGGYTLQTPVRFSRQAADEIRLYHQENITPHPSIPLPPIEDRARASLCAMLLLCAFFILEHKPWPELGLYPHMFSRLGAGDATAILSGQWWRLFTALTLHADPAHIASNAVVGGAFLILLSRRLDSGTAWLVCVLSGAAGNLLNALIQGPGHISIGFSTAVFGAAGALAGLRVLSGEGPLFTQRTRSVRGSGWLIPVAAALALVATLGTAGENTDIGAHFFGLFAGGGLGLLAGYAAVRLGYPNETWGVMANRAAGALAAALLAVAWACAWMFG